MSANGWLPHEYQDETIPPVRATPDLWIIIMADGAPALASGDIDDGDEITHHFLADGEIVEFDRLTDHGGATLTINGDGSYAVDRPMPPGANYVRTDCDIIDESIESMIENSEQFGPGITPGRHDLDYYHWSDEPIRLRFDAATRRFLEVVQHG